MTMQSARLAALALCVLSSALVSGFFYAYHCSVMPGLAAADPVAAIKAMQGINVAVRNATFAFSFFGTLGFGAAAILLLARAGGWPLVLTLLGAAIYAIGAFLVTLLYNVPLNEGLAGITPTAENATRIWRSYLDSWMLWNGLRMLASILAFAMFAAALVTQSIRPYIALQHATHPHPAAR